MHNFIIRLIACFIPDGKTRRTFRAKYLHKTINDKIRDLSEKKQNLNEGICDLKNKICNLIDNQNALNKEILYIKNFLLNTTDITKIPQSYSFLRIVQKSSLAVLKHFDKIAKKHNIQYWLGFGTLLGAIRHNDFIPWDDDIDICVLRSDYNKLEKILKSDFTDKEFHFSYGEIIRLFYKKTPAQVDIFPIDQGWQSEKLSGKEEQDFINKLYKINDSINYNWWPNLEQQKPVISKQELQKVFSERDNFLMKGHKPTKKGFCFLAAEASFAHRELFSYDTIFPLKPFNFCGIKTHIPNNTFLYLIKTYGDFMQFPHDICPKHDDIQKRLTHESITDMKKLIEQNLS